MKRILLKWIALISACAAVPIGMLLGDDRARADESPAALAERIEKGLKEGIERDADFLEELLRSAADGDGGFKIELDGTDAKKLLEGDRGEMFNRLRELLGGDEPRRADARESRRKPGRNEKDHRSAMEDYKPVVAAARKSTARVLDRGGRQVALATVVHRDGYLLSKASELPGRFVVCEFADGRELRAERVDFLAGWDLALLKVDADDLVAVDFADGETPDLGTFLAASGIGPYPVAIGVVSVSPRNLSKVDRGFLGIGMEGAEGGIKVSEVHAHTAAALAGIEVGDVMFEVDGQAVRAPADLAKAISSHRPRDVIRLRYRRQGEVRETSATLGSRQFNARRLQHLDRTQRMGGPLSESRGNFPNALQHDLTLLPEECGGPLVDLDGKVVGVNLARGGRVKSYAIPAADLIRLLGDLESGRFAMTAGREQRLARELEESENEVVDLERLLQRARERRDSFKDSLAE